MALEKIALEDDYFVQRKLYPNVDFYSGIVQKAIGIPVQLFTAIFALARTVGWIAQLNEMISDPEYKIGRPRQLYIGAHAAHGGADRGTRIDRTRGGAAAPTSCFEGCTMGTHEGIRGDQHAVRQQRAVHRGAVRAYLADPGERRRPSGARYFDELRGDAADVAHAPVIESFVELARNRRVAGAMVDATTMHKQVLVLRLISKFRTLGMLHADLDPLKRQEPPYIPDLDLRDLRLHRSRHGHASSTSARSRRAPRGCACATSSTR